MCLKELGLEAIFEFEFTSIDEDGVEEESAAEARYFINNRLKRFVSSGRWSDEVMDAVMDLPGLFY